MDDVTLGGSQDAVVRDVQTVMEVDHEVGQVCLNIPKCELISRAGCVVTDPTLQSFLQIPVSDRPLDDQMLWVFFINKRLLTGRQFTTNISMRSIRRRLNSIEISFQPQLHPGPAGGPQNAPSDPIIGWRAPQPIKCYDFPTNKCLLTEHQCTTNISTRGIL